jgi:S-adenosylmethionine:tRNA ribosyltransferase-isomerase
MPRGGGSPNKHGHFRDLADHLPDHSLLVVNDTRVLAARLRARKPTGGEVDLLLTRSFPAAPTEGPLGKGSAEGPAAGFSEIWEALGRGLGKAPSGLQLEVAGSADARPVIATIVERGEEGRFVIRVEGRGAPSLASILDEIGEVPLPPYVLAARHAALGAAGGSTGAVDDRVRYQTVYASAPGAVAAPTAGLHFTETLLAELRARGHELAKVTLHVGPGTFRPVKTSDPRGHRMDEEHYTIIPEAAEAIGRARSEGRPVIAIGTTVVRTLEASARANSGDVKAGRGTTDLFILPGDPFAVVTGLVTNFHLPRSTLLMLVCAFAGQAPVLGAYHEAVALGYRFYSYGDAMFIRPRDQGPTQRDGA